MICARQPGLRQRAGLGGGGVAPRFAVPNIRLRPFISPLQCTSGPAAELEVQTAATEQLSSERGWSMLKDFSRKEFRGLAAAFLATKEQRQLLRDAVLAVHSQPNPSCGWTPDVPDPEVLLGIVSSDVRLAVRGLRDWCEALGMQYVVPELRTPGASTLAEVRGNVYVKYNSRTKLCYVSPYHGKDRGVLLQLGSEQLGHFPLGMWDEEQHKPPPQLS